MTNNPAIVDVQDIQEDIVDAIKILSYKEKIKAVALNHYLKKKKDQDNQLEKEMKKLQKKYDILAAPIFQSQNQIIDGSRIPNEEELKDLDQYLNEDEIGLKNQALNCEPIKGYWSKALQNSDIIAQEIKDKDELVLKYLSKIEYIPIDHTENFVLSFHFHPNEYFTNSVLKKQFMLKKCENPVRSDGTIIEWKEGMDMTKRTVKRKQRNKKNGALRVVAQEVDAESFFNFFGSLNMDDQEAQDDKDQEEMDKSAERMDIDYDIARMIIDEIIPYSLEYYLGIKMDQDHRNLQAYSQEGSEEEQDDQNKNP